MTEISVFHLPPWHCMDGGPASQKKKAARGEDADAACIFLQSQVLTFPSSHIRPGFSESPPHPSPPSELRNQTQGPGSGAARGSCGSSGSNHAQAWEGGRVGGRGGLEGLTR